MNLKFPKNIVTVRPFSPHKKKYTYIGSSSSVAPAGLRGELRLWREGPPRTHRPAPPLPTNRAVLLCVWGWSACALEHPCVVQEVVHFYGACPEVFEWLYVLSGSVCVSEGSVGLCVLGCPQHCCRGCMCLFLTGWLFLCTRECWMMDTPQPGKVDPLSAWEGDFLFADWRGVSS